MKLMLISIILSLIVLLFPNGVLASSTRIEGFQSNIDYRISGTELLLSVSPIKFNQIEAEVFIGKSLKSKKLLITQFEDHWKAILPKDIKSILIKNTKSRELFEIKF